MAGLNDFGENRVQEALEKKRLVYDLLPADLLIARKIRWHLIGHLQSNKVNKAVEVFDVIHSIDSIDKAEMVGEASAQIGKVIDCYVQVNTSGEDSKSGTTLDEAESVAASVVSQASLKMIGLMTIGAWTDDQTITESCFYDLRALRDRIGLTHPNWGTLGLSMGMSGDYELAVACGASVVRIGTALFGVRNKSTVVGGV